MMKKVKLLTLLITGLLFINLKAQDIQVVVHETFKYKPVGTYEIIIDFEVVNISNEEQTVFEKRTVNDLPPGWTSSLCVGLYCFASWVDSIAAEPPFEDPLQPGDTMASSMHVFTDTASLNIGTSYIQIEVGTFNNPNNRIIIDFVITNDPGVDVKNEEIPTGYFLSQNYPNPFNPSTKIKYGVKEGGQVTLKVYNILGVEVATLVNGYKPAGTYEAFLNGAKLSSGVYIYSLSVNGFRQTRKMILEK